MPPRALVYLMLLSSTGFAAPAGTAASLLGVHYSEWFAADPTQMATDSSGALYILGYYTLPNGVTLPTGNAASSALYP